MGPAVVADAGAANAPASAPASVATVAAEPGDLDLLAVAGALAPVAGEHFMPI